MGARAENHQPQTNNRTGGRAAGSYSPNSPSGLTGIGSLMWDCGLP